MGLLDKIKAMVGGNADKAEDGVAKAGDMVDEKTDNKFTDEVDMAEEKIGEVIEDQVDDES